MLNARLLLQWGVYTVICTIVATTVDQLDCLKSGLCQRDIETLRIAEIKKTILSELNLVDPPMIDQSKMPSPTLREEYKKMAEQMLSDVEDEKKNGLVSYLIPGEDPSFGEDLSSLVARFPIRDDMDTSKIVGAALTFYIRIPSNSSRQNLSVQIYEKSFDGVLGELIETKTFSVEQSGRLSIELSAEDVKRWYASNPIQGVFVSGKHLGHNVAVHPQETSVDHENMILKLTFSTSQRKKRAAVPVCARGSPHTGCCLYDLEVDFEKLGWEWIIAPEKYNAYICQGICSSNSVHHHGGIIQTQAESGHTKVLKAFSRTGNKSYFDTVGLCCHPTDFDYIRLVYVNRDGRAIVSNVHGMVARRCACS